MKLIVPVVFGEDGGHQLKYRKADEELKFVADRVDLLGLPSPCCTKVRPVRDLTLQG